MTTTKDDEVPSPSRPTGLEDPMAPWWAGLGPVGAVAAIVLGVGAVVWISLGLPGVASETEASQGYYGAAKVVAVGLVVVGTTLLARFRARATDTETDTATDAATNTETDTETDTATNTETDAATDTGTGAGARGEGGRSEEAPQQG